MEPTMFLWPLPTSLQLPLPKLNLFLRGVHSYAYMQLSSSIIPVLYIRQKSSLGEHSGLPSLCLHYPFFKKCKYIN